MTISVRRPLPHPLPERFVLTSRCRLAFIAQGESSGGGSVINHLLAYGGESKPPFHAAVRPSPATSSRVSGPCLTRSKISPPPLRQIGQSPANDPFPFPAGYEACFVNATQSIGCEGADDVASCLRSASVGAIVSAVSESSFL